MANPFDDDYRSSSATRNTKLKSYTHTDNIEDEADYYEKEIEKYMQESLDSTERSKRHLENSEKIGTQTAQDLLEQREKLERTERNLDEIHRTTQVTQRNLNSLKSVFGGFFKNKFSRKPPESIAEMPQSKSASKLSDTVGDLNTGGSSASFSGMSSTGQPTLSESSRNAIKGTRWEAMDNQIDENLGNCSFRFCFVIIYNLLPMLTNVFFLDVMSKNLRNLRRLGEDLGREVDEQNQMLDRIQTKADRNDAIVRVQDKQVRKIFINVFRELCLFHPIVPNVFVILPV
ncbi:unnamed protein product [Strongylus vulgaris]|uniref:t-SNARE coiled-coil homology domain-containing protein n=1 Tax=Strongylus vulgaris TaxID=40348 RepID=A0A3P7IVP6_STRVU|nr:unnamed protein product [Strongylus vulgaris]